MARSLYALPSGGSADHGRSRCEMLAVRTEREAPRGSGPVASGRDPDPQRMSRGRPPVLHRGPTRRAGRRDLLLAVALQNVTGSVFSPRSVRLWRYSGRSVARASFGSFCTSVLSAI